MAGSTFAGLRAARRTALILAAAAVVLVASSAAPAGFAAGPLTFSLSIVGAYGGEPAIISDNHGILYDTTPSGPLTYRSRDKGATWQKIQSPDTASGDDCLGMDQANALYWCNLAGSQGNAPLQADMFKSLVAPFCTTDCKWVHGDAAVPGGQCGTSCNPFGVDRDWAAASIPAGKTTDNATVALMYHDFYGPSSIWVSVSVDGGRSYGAPTPVLASPAITPGAVTGSLVAQGFTFCNTVPAGVQIVPPGKPNAGRIYVAWIASDAAQDLGGCNVTMIQSFHTAFISYSDDLGASWTAQEIIDMGIGRDMSTPFAGLAIDSEGNPYFDFASQPMGTLADTETCAAESEAGTQQGDAKCAYNMYVVWSKDGGATWDGGGGVVPGSAAAAYKVNPDTEGGTHFFPAIAVGKPGQVDVAYLRTSAVIPTDSVGKALPGACAGPTVSAQPNFPPTCDWYLYGGQSLNLDTATPTTATWTTTQLTPKPMHYGDICNLGIFCVPTVSNRNLLDFIQETIDPTTGCAHIGYSDDNAGTIGDPNNLSPYGNHLVSANQTSGCLGTQPRNDLLLGVTPNTSGPRVTAPLAGAGLVLLVAGILAATVGRRRKTA